MKSRRLTSSEYKAVSRASFEAAEKARKADILFQLVEILDERKNRDNAETISLFETLGYRVRFSRFRVSGGVGSFQWMPKRKVFRLQICAAVQGRPDIRQASAKWLGSSLFTRRASRRYFFRYAYCVEI